MPRPAADDVLDPATAAAIRAGTRLMAAPTAALPLAALVKLGAALAGSRYAVDCESARRIGVPIVVLRPRSSAPAAGRLALTRREREVAALLARGLRNRVIAAELKMALPTAKDHVHNIMRRNGFSSRAALAAALVRDGF